MSVRNVSFRSKDESIQYYVETPQKWGFRTSRVTRWEGARRVLVGTIDWSVIGVFPRVRIMERRNSIRVDNLDGDGDTGDEDAYQRAMDEERERVSLKRGRMNKIWSVISIPSKFGSYSVFPTGIIS